MGLLIEGQWHDRWYDTQKTQGDFKREEAQLRHWITPDGQAGPTGKAGFKAQSKRYHLYVSFACPWAHRTLIFRALKGLQTHIDVSVVSPDMLSQGWSFNVQEGSSGDKLFDSPFLHAVYTRHQASYTGRVTVPVLWDTQQNEIVSNESSEIIRMFNSAFDAITGNTLDFYPEALRQEIDHWNTRIYETVNNGVYRCGFATSQHAYEHAYDALFKSLEDIEQHLAKNAFLAGDIVTEADWRLFTTLIRFDSVYHGHFKCNLKRIEDYPHLSQYLRALYQVPGIAQTTHFDHIQRHYYYSHDMINPSRIVPKGPAIDYTRAHNRGQVLRDT